MLGLWPDVITSNLAAEAANKAYAAKHLPDQTLWLHAQDFRIHAHLQLAQDHEAKRIVDERNTIEKLVPVRLPNETAFAAIPVRYATERGRFLNDGYQRKCTPSALGYRPPAAFERRWRQQETVSVSVKLAPP